FPKIGVAFMPPLDEGTMLDMPVTVPRASVTQAADDLKARDALLRGFPEVESVIGKAGRASTPTDPAPLDMVETFVNFRPKELWPKRVLKYSDARKQAERILDHLQQQGFMASISDDDRRNLLNDAAQRALERFDEELRELALLRYGEFDQELKLLLTRYAVTETVRRLRAPGDLAWPAGMDEQAEVDRLAGQYVDKYGHWLASHPALEDVTQLSLDVAGELKERGALSDIAGAQELREPLPRRLASAVRGALGGEHRTFAGELLAAVETERTRLWQNRVKHVNWELFDRGTEGFCWYALQELAKAAQHGAHLGGAPRGAETAKFGAAALDAQLGKRHPPSIPRGEVVPGLVPGGSDVDSNQPATRAGATVPAALAPFLALADELSADFKQRVFFWPRQTGPKGDLVDDEMGRVLQVPGWSNIFTQPIINRIEMLSTGVRTDIGVKVFGPDLGTIDRVCKQVEAALKPLNGARDVVAAPFMGKGYLQVDIDREKAARYGISIEDVENEIEVALAGKAITYTVEDRDRFPVRIRYARAEREEEESIRRLLISPGTMSRGRAGGSGMDGESNAGIGSVAVSSQGHSAAPGHAARGTPLIPLSALADVKVVDGPAMIKSENSRLVNYVTLMVRGRDIVGFVDEAQRVVAEKVTLPQGVHIEWSGEFEHQVRAAKTLRLVFPIVIALIFIILYLTYNDLMDAVLMMLAVPEALAGGAFFMYLFPKILRGWDTPPMDFSVAVWVGFIACFGMATETGIIMLVYLREAIEKRGGLENIGSLAELRQAVIEGAVHRLRPKLLTEGVAIIAIFPMVFAKGVGGEILAPMALPVLGGLLISDEVVDLFLPVRFYWVRRGRWLKLQEKKRREEHASVAEPALETV
ncbi:MAG TPA: efflux RND transporter permease subunit, partial [Pirellulales bacterium]|nr:efflux RND transporter permease subunit [Pirellulales bacterium]